MDDKKYSRIVYDNGLQVKFFTFFYVSPLSPTKYIKPKSLFAHNK